MKLLSPDELEASLFLPAGSDGSGLRLTGNIAGKPFSRPIELQCSSLMFVPQSEPDTWPG